MKNLRQILPKRQAAGVAGSRVFRLLAVVLALSLALGALLLNYTPTMAGSPVLVNYPAGINTAISGINFETKKFQSFYDPAYSGAESANVERTRYPASYPPAYPEEWPDDHTKTRQLFPNGTSGFLNGSYGATPDHIVLDGDQARFFGYSSTPYFDYMFTNNASTQPIGLEFDMEPGKWNFHCFKRTGLFVKSTIDAQGRISGYMLSIGSNAIGTVAQNSAVILNTDGTVQQPDLSFALFKVENMNIDAYNKFITDNSAVGLVPNDHGDPSADWNNDGVVDNADYDPGTPYTSDGTDGYTAGTIVTPMILKAANNPRVFDEQKYLGQYYTLFQATPTQSGYSVTGNYAGTDPTKLDYFFEGQYGLPKGSSITQVQLEDNPSFNMLMTGVEKMHCRVDITSTTLSFYVTMYFKDAGGNLVAQPEVLLFSQAVAADSTTRNGFGLYCQYLAHACQMLTHITFSSTHVTTADPTKPATSATVRFQQYGTGGGGQPALVTLQPAETMNGYTGDQYSVNPPKSIVYNGKTYFYFRSSRWTGTGWGGNGGSETLDPLTYAANASNNETILYYVLAPTVAKNARLNSGTGTINNGTAGGMVPVKYGDVIYYTVTITNPNTSTITNFGATVTDLLPAGLQFVSAAGTTTGVRSNDPAGSGRDLVTWTINTLAVGATNLTVQARVTDPYAQFINTANVSFEGLEPEVTNPTYHESKLDPITIEKEARITEDPGGPNEFIHITNAPGTAATPIQVTPGDLIRYTLVVTNPNPQVTGVNALVEDYLPTGLNYVSDDHGGNASTVGSRTLVSWQLNNVANGKTEITVVCSVDVSNQTFINSARVSPNHSKLAPNNSNETYHQSGALPVVATKSATRVRGNVAGSLTAASPVEVEKNDYVDYTIKVGNPNISAPVADINFNYDYTHSGYDTAYTSAQSAYYNNGVATPDHVVRNGASIAFNGYGAASNFDVLFTDAFNIDTMEFDFKPSSWGTHTFKRTGVFIKSGITSAGVLSGYFLNIGSIDNNLSQTQTATSYYLSLMRVDNLNIPSSNTTNSTYPSPWTITPPYGFPPGTTVQELQRGDQFTTSSPAMHVRIVTTATSITIYTTPITTGIEVKMFDLTLAAPDNYSGTGFCMQNIAHSCSVLTHVEFTNVYLSVSSKLSTETTVTDLIPEGMKVISVNSDDPLVTYGVTIDPVTGRELVTWHADELAAGQTAFTVRVQVDPNRLPETDYENNARVQMKDMGVVRTNSTYHRMTNVMTLHIRQMVLNRDGTTVPLPGIAYYNMQNDGTNLGLDSLSGLDGVSQTPFTTYTLPLNNDTEYAIQDLIAQYYKYAGYVVTPTNAPHSSASRSTGSIVLDYENDYEQWLTVYIIPEEPAGHYTWDIRTNDFGRLDVPTVF
ncbi:MAG: DUF11 domain-containing protein [Oscillospiraceae bacterium]|nr:DUF11 domain-containing protein [Oscillospiraceae bacterium]